MRRRRLDLPSFRMQRADANGRAFRMGDIDERNECPYSKNGSPRAAVSCCFWNAGDQVLRRRTKPRPAKPRPNRAREVGSGTGTAATLPTIKSFAVGQKNTCEVNPPGLNACNVSVLNGVGDVNPKKVVGVVAVKVTEGLMLTMISS